MTYNYDNERRKQFYDYGLKASNYIERYAKEFSKWAVGQPTKRGKSLEHYWDEWWNM